jgi:predicted AAA+ superfamily ATPase
MNYFKIYLTNPSLRSALFSPMKPTDEFMGNIVETTIYAQWMHRDWLIPYYARWTGGEVDMVSLNSLTMKPQWAVEIKWSNRYFDKPSELRSLVRFCKENELASAIVTTLDKEGKKEFDGLTLFFVPSALYAYTVGRNTLTLKRDKG